MNPFTHECGAKFLNIPAATAVLKEVFEEDSYHFSEIHAGCIVIDIGAFYGEFGIAARVAKDCHVLAFEPSLENFQVASLNAASNQLDDRQFALLNCAIGAKNGTVQFQHNDKHPAGSGVIDGDLNYAEVPCWTMKDAISVAKERYGFLKPIFVKMDCEGSEEAIFAGDTKWLKRVSMLAMEWHNKDGHIYACILKEAGFTVELTGGGPKPRPEWEPGMSGGLIFAKKDPELE